MASRRLVTLQLFSGIMHMRVDLCPLSFLVYCCVGSRSGCLLSHKDYPSVSTVSPLLWIEADYVRSRLSIFRMKIDQRFCFLLPAVSYGCTSSSSNRCYWSKEELNDHKLSISCCIQDKENDMFSQV